MTRGSPVERSAEERELARQERARRRAEREGQPPPPLEEQPPPEQPPDTGVDAATQQWDVLAETEPPAPVYEPALTSHEGDQFDYASNVVAHQAHGSDEHPEPAAHEPEPAQYTPDPVAHQPEPAQNTPEPVAHEADPAQYPRDPVAHEADPAPDPAQYTPEPLAHEPHDAPLAVPIPDEHIAGAPSTEELAAAEEPPAPEAEPPPPRTPLPKRGAARRVALAGDEGGRLPPLPAAARAPLEPRRRSSSTRIAALAALVLVVVAAIVVLIAGGSSSNSKTSSTATPTLLHVVVPEGQTRLQIARTAERVGLTGSYRAASKRSQLLDPASYGAPPGTPDLEGFLFPATYDLNPRAPAARLVEDQLIAFKENFGAKQVAHASALHITPYQLLIVASMVEREAQVPSDRAKIAAVIYNRLHAGMPLGIDATLYYAIEMRGNIPTYTKELTESDLHMSSRYNTRTHVGLPPTPIANPGMASIEAAGKPAHASYLYYVLGADGCGEHVFSTSEAQFDVNAAAYQAAVSKNGGHPPTCKKR